MTGIDWRIPPSLLKWLEQAPSDAAVAILLRHSVRDDLPPGDAGYALPITPAGVAIAEQLGEMLGERLKTLHSSPLLRCVQTAEALRSGSKINTSIVRNHLLGDPGAFVLDGKQAWVNWQESGHEAVMQHLVSEDFALPGMADPEPAAHYLVRHMLSVAGSQPGVHIFVTHDSVVTAAAARLLGRVLGAEDWPWYLEGAFFWEDGDGLVTAYRDEVEHQSFAECDAFTDRNIIDFARREVAMTVGLDIAARFFLAGGMFKSLLTGRAPRDLDFWAPSQSDRDALVAALLERGALRLPGRPFADAFAIGGRVVELPIKTEPATLSARLARFDLGLAAIGAEHHPGGDWNVIIHPLAQASVERGEVLLLKPLVNWKYALATLERMRRYARDLGYSVPVSEEDEIWTLFSQQSDEMKRGMVERLARTSNEDMGVLAEVSSRM
jgi:broad specificity phosphatase PhoE